MVGRYVQTTVKAAVAFAGIGLHSGRPARVTVRPASAEYGIWFRRIDVTERDPMVPARWDAVVASQLCTRIENPAGVSVTTIEHLMAALAGCGIHNALIEIDGPEVPILDGSSAPFVRALMARGLRRLQAPLRALRVLKPIEVRRGEAIARLEPCEGTEISFEIDFTDRAIGHQEKCLSMENGTFVRELCDSRTFCRRSDITEMQRNGLALGGVPGCNAVVFDGDDVVSPGGLRHEDEAVRHKMLDALGDLSLAGCPILGRYRGVRAGHALTNQLMRALFATPRAFEPLICDAQQSARLPGYAIGRADLARLAIAA